MHPNTEDALRRQTESKLIRYKQRYLCALPESAAKKSAVLRELDELVNGAVLLGIPDDVAWTIYLEAQDCETIGQLRLSIDRSLFIPA
jgi:superkiller protein 3